MAALFSDDSGFYVGAATTWLLAACVAVEILCGWVLGHRLRAKLFHLLVLMYGLQFGEHALKLRTFLANIPAYRRLRCPAAVVGVPSGGECILMEGAYVEHLLRAATSSFYLTTVILGFVIWKKESPRRRRVPGWAGVGTTFIEILLFVLCVVTCACSVPDLISDYNAATANRVLDRNT